MMFIDSHTHGMHAERNAAGKLAPPLMPARVSGKQSPEDYVRESRERGIEKIVLLDPPEITFEMKRLFGDYVIPVPQVDMDFTSPEELEGLFQRGAVGIKFISPAKSYGSDSYLPLYDVIRAHQGVAVFHTGFLALDIYEPGGLFGRTSYTDITDMRPAALDRVARALPELKILMAHFGNPWWEEAWKMCSSHKNIYADLSGGTCHRRSLDMWAQIFAPDGKLDVTVMGKLCFGTDYSYFAETSESRESLQEMLTFYARFMERLKVPEELRQKVYRDTILALTDPRSSG